jgi:hypothetical protein
MSGMHSGRAAAIGHAVVDIRDLHVSSEHMLGKCLQVMGGSGLTNDTIVEQVFREIRAFRIYDGPTEVHKWALAKKIKRDWATVRE